jgi:hypothetical protein
MTEDESKTLRWAFVAGTLTVGTIALILCIEAKLELPRPQRGV